MEVALMVKNLSVNLGGKQILDGVTFNVPKGGMTVLMGANGSGKTTFMRAICGNLQTDCGEITLFGKRLCNMKRSEHSRMVAYIPQAHTPVFCYSVLDFVLMGAVSSKSIYLQPNEKDIAHATSIITRLGMKDFIQTDYSILSGGERQLVLIARGLMQSAPLLLLDEPVANLDFANQYKIMNILKTLSQEEITVIAALHDPNLALKYADYIVLLQNARVVAVLTKEKADFACSLQNVLKNIYGNVQLTESEHFEVIV
ncbi:MAG: ABC transporter ATP-binding protein [Candidatus Humimicrobiaceae bacterium]